MLSVTYAECQLRLVSFANPFALSGIRLNIVMLSVVMLSVVILSVVTPIALFGSTKLLKASCGSHPWLAGV